MLGPGARRKDVLRQLHRSSENLILPWLCPALLRYQGPPIHRRPIARPLPSTGGYHAKRCISQTSRHHATAGGPAPISLGDPYIPFESVPFVQGSPIRPWSGGPTQTEFPGLDPSSLVILEEEAHNATSQERVVLARDGNPGSVAEMRIIYQACLRLHRYKRAEVLLRRFGKMFAENKPALLEVHNQYLHSMVSYIMTNRKASMLAPLQKWFEVEMRRRLYQLEPDATSYALMIKASLHSLHGPKRDRTVRRYIALASDDGVENETLGLPILTDAELGQISEVSWLDRNLL
jgi:DNA-directed RNA polymerase